MPSAKSAEVKVEIKADAADAIKDVKKAGDALHDLDDAARRIDAGGIDDVTKAVGDLKKSTDEASTSAGGISDALQAGLAGGAVAGAVSKLSDIVSEGFAKLGELASDAFAAALDMEKSRAVLQAQLGTTAEDAARLGRLAGDLYSENYGSSLQDVNDAISEVGRTLGLTNKAVEGQLKDVTGKVLNLASVFNVDVTDAVKGVTSLVKSGMVGSAGEALDLITRGFQKGLDKSGDLLDTLEEYPTTWKELGLTADEALGLISQGLESGARNSDQVADALKELGIRAQDNSATTRDAFKALGLNADVMGKAFATGGDAAKQGMQKVLDGLRDIKDPLEQRKVAVELFGTKAEDMGNALNELDPSHAVEALGKVGGAADDMGKALDDTADAKIEKFKRSVETNIVTFLTDTVLPKLEEFATKVADTFHQLTESDWWNTIKADFEELRDKILPPLTDAFGFLYDIIKNMITWVKDNKDTVEGFKLLLEGTAVAALAVAAGIGFIMVALGLLVGAIAIAIAFGLGKLYEMFNNIKTKTTEVRDAITDMAHDIRDKLNELKVFGVGLWDWLLIGLGPVIKEIKDLVQGLVDFVNRALDKLRGEAGVIGGVASGGGIGGRSVIVPALAGGGIVRRPTLALIGEAGAEAVVPLSQMSGATFNITIQTTGLAVDSPRLQRDLVECLDRYTRRNGPVTFPVGS